jgi:ABC-type Fe3+ transport system permease subunit
VILWGQLLDLSGGIEDLIQLKETVSFFDAGIRSLFISFASGLFMMVLLASVAYVLPHKNFQRFLLSYMAPSTALLGLAWLKWTPPSTGAVSLVIIVVGLCFLSLPLIYRLRLDSAFHSLTHQIDVASTMGADWNQIFWRIVIPQLWPSLCLGASLMAFWAAGEFAFSSLVAPSDFSLSLLTKGLTDSYRIEAASTLSWLNLVLGLMGWLFFRSLKDVFSYRAH